MIENNVPLPKYGQTKYDFTRLLPGQSAFEECAKEDRMKVRKAAYQVANRKNWKVIVRSEKTGIRMWRVE